MVWHYQACLICSPESIGFLILMKIYICAATRHVATVTMHAMEPSHSLGHCMRCDIERHYPIHGPDSKSSLANKLGKPSVCR